MTDINDLFADIRPYYDAEVPDCLSRLRHDNELQQALSQWLLPKLHRRLPRASQWLVRQGLAWKFKQVRTVDQFQDIMAKPLARVLRKSTAGLSLSGLEQLDPKQAYLFVSNHRDIVMDPALVNWSLYQQGLQTVRIAIGDNLLSRPYASDLMRLNKSFIVKRSVTGMREKLKAAKQLSLYIHHCIVRENANVWIAQREGRAKDGYDRTNPAIIGMFSLSCPKDRRYADYINELNIVPVSISYEQNPCDSQHAQELLARAKGEQYAKSEGEDLRSIARGITGNKGRVHLAFGQPLQGNFDSDAQVAAEIDQQIQQNLRLYPVNHWALARLEGLAADPTDTSSQQLADRLQQMDDDLARMVLVQYANAIRMKEGLAPLSTD